MKQTLKQYSERFNSIVNTAADAVKKEQLPQGCPTEILETSFNALAHLEAFAVMCFITGKVEDERIHYDMNNALDRMEKAFNKFHMVVG